jgi:hypothetical protein
MTQASIRRHIAREALISGIISGAISVAFVFLVFLGPREVPVWGVRGLVTDCIPQGFMIGLMGALVPSLLARRSLSAGRLPIGHSPDLLLLRIVRGALLSAVASAAALTGAAAAVLAIGGWNRIEFIAALVLKAGAGVALGVVVTRITLRRLLGTN